MTSRDHLFTLDVTAPGKTPTRFAMEGPLAKSKSINIDGKPAQAAASTIDLSGGTHHILIQE